MYWKIYSCSCGGPVSCWKSLVQNLFVVGSHAVAWGPPCKFCFSAALSCPVLDFLQPFRNEGNTPNPLCFLWPGSPNSLTIYHETVSTSNTSFHKNLMGPQDQVGLGGVEMERWEAMPFHSAFSRFLSTILFLFSLISASKSPKPPDGTL